MEFRRKLFYAAKNEPIIVRLSPRLQRAIVEDSSWRIHVAGIMRDK